MHRLDDRVALVTGAGSGIGRAIARRYAKEGATVVIVDIDDDAARAAAREIEAARGSALALHADVAESDQVDAVFEAAVVRCGAVDVLVNNAGIGRLDPELLERAMAAVGRLMAGEPGMSLGVSRDLSDADWRRMVEVHLFGTFYCTRAALRHMEEQRRGVIINIASTHGLSGFPGLPHYSAAKGGIIALTKSVAIEVAGAGIRVNAIAPGAVDTPMLSAMPEAARQMLLSRTPQGRIGTPDDIAGVAAFLAGDDAAYITGQVISPNGGFYT
jgi:3-oxoacyl-[acyl-carrier protein] reductase